jgi:hypothetical protein
MKTNRKPKPEPFRPTDDQIRGVLRFTEAWWNELSGIEREHLREIGTRELRRMLKK